jgi:hypothetical protein
MDGNDVGLNDAVHGCLHATDFRIKGGIFKVTITLHDA